jgi:ATP-dependent DNA helicase DinG
MNKSNLLEITDRIFREGGVLEQTFHFPHRKGQHLMAMAVAQALTENKTAIPEAGTGTGKTLAYGIPLTIHAMSQHALMKAEGRLEDWMPFAISVHTVALQEQLSYDSALIQSVIREIGLPFAQIKRLSGRTNYFCENTANELWKNPKTNPESRDRIGAVIAEHNGKKGRRDYEGLFSQLDTSKKLDPTLRQAVSAHERNCKCENCNRATAWKDAKASQVVILNHALAQHFDYQKVVVDEAHTYEGVVASNHEFEINLNKLSEEFENENPKNIPAGATAPYATWQRNLRTVLQTFLTELKKHGIHVSNRNGNYFRIPPEEIMGEKGKSRDKCQDTFGIALRELQVARYDLVKYIDDLHGTSGKGAEVGDFLAQYTDKAEVNKHDEPNVRDLNLMPGSNEEKAVDRILDISRQALKLGELLEGEKAIDARWVEILEEDGSQNYVIHKAMVDMSHILGAQHAFGRTACLTSATLSGFQGLESFRKAQGIPAGESIELECPTPFDIEKQVEFRVPENMPSPGAREMDYQNALPAAVRECVLKTQEVSGQRAGGTLVLFTSKVTMEKTFEKLEGEIPNLAKQQFNLSKQEQLEWMKKTPGAVMFGLDSFWTGVDLPGDALKHVVITRLPFKPGSWREEKKREIAVRNGENGFLAVDVNDALLPFHQGCGRLIRKTDDTGVITVLDTRIETANYGAHFRKGLPHMQKFKIQELPELEKTAYRPRTGYNRGAQIQGNTGIGL